MASALHALEIRDAFCCFSEKSASILKPRKRWKELQSYSDDKPSFRLQATILTLKIPLPLFVPDYGSKVHVASRLYISRVPSQSFV